MASRKKKKRAAKRRAPNPKPPAPSYAATHGGLEGDMRSKRVKVPDPRAGKLIVLGRLKRLEYVTDKGEGESVYFHLLGRRKTKRGEDERSKSADERCPYLVFNGTGLIIAGGQYEVRPEGIVG